MIMTETAEDYELIHFGVKGMKWGVRRDRDSSTKRTPEQKRYEKELKKTAEGDLRNYRSQGSPLTKNSRGEPVKKLNKRVQDKYDSDPDYKKAFDRAVQTETRRKAVTTAKWTLYGLYAVDMIFNRGAVTRAVVGGVVKGAAGATATGASAAAKMFESGDAAHTYIDQTGKILRNVKPRFS